MAYQLSFERQAGYLHVRITGDNTFESILAYLREVHSLCVREQSACVLIEENLTGKRLSITELFSLVTRATENVSADVQYIAFVDASPARDPSRITFAETVAVNRGVNMRQFHGVADARAWLQAKISATFPAVR
ncbi:MAG TPA: hypothetical protein VEK08_24730 [Planctomycetota bacterium]|nr:hypothetical protein [Planctomycetota bacterium]